MFVGHRIIGSRGEASPLPAGIPIPAGNLNFGELSLPVREKRLGDLFRSAIAFDPVAASVLCSVIRCGTQSLSHCIGVDCILDFLGKLFLDGPPIALDGDGGGDVLPIKDPILCHSVL